MAMFLHLRLKDRCLDRCLLFLRIRMRHPLRRTRKLQVRVAPFNANNITIRHWFLLRYLTIHGGRETPLLLTRPILPCCLRHLRLGIVLLRCSGISGLQCAVLDKLPLLRDLEFLVRMPLLHQSLLLGRLVALSALLLLFSSISPLAR